MTGSDETKAGSKTVAIDTEHLSAPTCHSCGRTENKETVLETIRMVGAYDEETGEYVDGDSPLEHGWELIVSAECELREADDRVRVIPEEFYVFCPECPADPDVAV